MNTSIPIHATTPIQILLFPSLRPLSLTREQKTPTRITESKLQDLTMTDAENEEKTIALLYVHILRVIMTLQIMDFLNEICKPCYFSPFLKCNMVRPIVEATSGGNKVKTIGAYNCSKLSSIIFL